MPKNTLPNIDIIDELKKASLDAFEHDHFLQSAIILFQLVEGLLRIAISGFGRNHGVSEENLKKAANNEQSFARLVLYLDLIYPENGLGNRLLNFNNKRNLIMHKIFYKFHSMDTLRNEVKDFICEAVKLNGELQKLLGLHTP